MEVLCLQTGEGDRTDVDNYIKSYILGRCLGRGTEAGFCPKVGGNPTGFMEEAASRVLRECLGFTSMA